MDIDTYRNYLPLINRIDQEAAQRQEQAKDEHQRRAQEAWARGEPYDLRYPNGHR